MRSKRGIVTEIVQRVFQESLGTDDVIPGSLPFVMHDNRSFCILDDGLGPPLYSVPQRLINTGDAVADIRTNGCIDVWRFLEICDGLEFAFGIRLPDDVVSKAKTVSELIACLSKLVSLPYLRQIAPTKYGFR